MATPILTEEMFWLIVGMGLVTFIPRLLPLIALKTENWPDWSKRMLARVPFAILGALIFPGILYVGPTVTWGVAGATVAAFLAYFKAPLIAVVAGAIVFLTILDVILY
ncbi:AzlD domain-containing protein [Salisediminibacterium beveridgei]|uniref:Branched-Chain Amino Acid Transport n=1 Tax=Salisediminibacterium beveridgei TaxID=632773 RepID=A0A1D7QWQ3_9BACI|nr:AzlD domain-containing protein [Salisediminibacterium beveridgei]AOM83399.1 Branched-Chain Amino Acid Transport [Salisediminibacterium beveridgei]